MKAILFVLTIVFSLIGQDDLFAQVSQDTAVIQDSVTIVASTEKEKKSSIFSGRPGKSLLMSLVIPGAGQIYNKSYLRVPFVWAAVGGTGWLLVHNTQQYRCYKEAYIHLIDGTPVTPEKHCDPNITLITNPETMRVIRDEANKNMQISILVFSAVWLANGIDAFVDAHLKDFDINEDLTIEFGSKFDDDPNSPMRMGIYVSF